MVDLEGGYIRHKAEEAYLGPTSPQRNPDWKQDTPSHQLTALLMAIEGYTYLITEYCNRLDHSKRHDIRAANFHIQNYLAQIRDLQPFLDKGSW
jgi:hypothetical protein